MKRLIEMSLRVARALVVLSVILALVVSGAGAAQRLFTDQCAPKVAENQPNSIALNSKPDPKEAAGGMATGSRPNTEQSLWLQANPALPAGSDQSRDRVNTSLAVSSVGDHQPLRHEHDLRQSPGRVAPQIGRRFTLVGARPSGTS